VGEGGTYDSFPIAGGGFKTSHKAVTGKTDSSVGAVAGNYSYVLPVIIRPSSYGNVNTISLFYDGLWIANG
jgi:hypothetical protein